MSDTELVDQVVAGLCAPLSDTRSLAAAERAAKELARRQRGCGARCVCSKCFVGYEVAKP